MRADRTGIERLVELGIIGFFWLFAVLLGVGMFAGLLEKAPVVALGLVVLVAWLYISDSRRKRRPTRR